MIDGIKVKLLTTHLTEDGFFREVLRDDDFIFVDILDKRNRPKEEIQC